MSQASRRTADILLIILPTVVFGGVSILRLLKSYVLAWLSFPLSQASWSQ